MHMLTRRLQILLDDDRYERLAAEANRRRVPVAVVVRDALDASLPVSRRRREEAARRILAAPPMAIESPAALIAELDALRHGGL